MKIVYIGWLGTDVVTFYQNQTNPTSVMPRLLVPFLWSISVRLNIFLLNLCQANHPLDILNLSRLEIHT